MTDPSSPSPTSGSASEPPTPPGPVSEPPRALRAGEPAPPGSFDGRARSFREQQTKRRGIRRERVGQLLVVAIIVLGVYAIVSAKPFNPASKSNYPSPGPPISVTLLSPVVSNLTCGQGGTAYVERIVWANSTGTVTTGDIATHLYEIWDGDYIADAGVVANVTEKNLCAGSPPDPSTLLWYVVMESPNGTILLSYTQPSGWVAVGPGPADIEIPNGSAMVVVTGLSLAGTGRGFAVVGFSNGSPIRGSVPL